MNLTDNLLAYYKFDSGELTIDATGNGYTLGNNNAVGGTSNGKIGYSADFGSSNTNRYFNYAVIIPYSASAWTIGCWLKLDSKLASHSYIVNLCNNGSRHRNFRIMYEAGTDRFRTDGYDGTVSFARANTLGSPSLDTWYFLVLTYDGTTNQLYVNGSADGSFNKTWGGDSVNPGNNNNTTLGVYRANQSATIFDPMRGLMDEAFFYDRALSSSEVSSLYNSGNGLQYPFSSTSVKSVNNLARASVKSKNNLAVGSIKSFNNLA